MPKSALKKRVTRRRKIRRLGKPTRANWGIAALAFLVLVILFGKIGGLLGSSASDISSKKYSWNGSSTINMVVKSDHIYVASFNPSDSSLTLLKVPDETYVDVPLGFGRWPIRSVYDLGQAESPPIGARLLKEAVSTSFGVPVDGYLIIPGDFEKIVEGVRKNPFSVITLIRKGQTDLNFAETFRFWWGIRGVRFDNLTVSDIGGTSFTSWVLLPDGSRVLRLDRLPLDQYIQSQFEDSEIQAAGLSVGVYNATDHPGLADQAARVIANMGGRVVFTANAGETLEKSTVSGDPSYTLTRMAQVFAPSCLPISGWPFGLFKSKAGCTISSSSIDTQRADIIVAVGEDYFARYNSRQ